MEVLLIKNQSLNSLIKWKVYMEFCIWNYSRKAPVGSLVQYLTQRGTRSQSRSVEQTLLTLPFPTGWLLWPLTTSLVLCWTLTGLVMSVCSGSPTLGAVFQRHRVLRRSFPTISGYTPVNTVQDGTKHCYHGTLLAHDLQFLRLYL